ncbi:MAG: thermonuclease family protein, partial [Chloroflexota bacterium]|nr:thermonuclease family protein [Chloroflexota bacterium]
WNYTSERFQMGEAGWVRNTDGDTPTVQLSIRMMGIDTPETHYPGIARPRNSNEALNNLLDTHGHLFSQGLRDYLAPLLKGKPGSLQGKWGRKAWRRFGELADDYLDARTDYKTGQLRRKPVYLTVGRQAFDRYHRLLAYAAPQEKDPQKRVTFNLLLMQDGMAVNYTIFPNLPKPEDLLRVQEAVRTARQEKRGFWKDGHRLLLPYEFRWCVDTARDKRQGPDKYCADITTGVVHQPQEYYTILPENRLFILSSKGHTQDLKEAMEQLGLIQGW